MKILYEVLGILALGFLLMITVNGIGMVVPFLKLPVLSLGDGVFIGWVAVGINSFKDQLFYSLGGNKEKDD